MAYKRKPRFIVQLDDELTVLIRDLAKLRGQSQSRVLAELISGYRAELRDTVEQLRVFKKKKRRATH